MQFVMQFSRHAIQCFDSDYSVLFVFYVLRVESPSRSQDCFSLRSLNVLSIECYCSFSSRLRNLNLACLGRNTRTL